MTFISEDMEGGGVKLKVTVKILDELEMMVTIHETFVIPRRDYEEAIQKIESIIEEYRI